MRYIGIDLGASFFKAGLLDTEQNRISRICKHSAPSPIQDCPPDRKELDPTLIWERICNLIQNVKGSTDIDGILISNQMHGFIILDTLGKPRTGYITWQDNRGSDISTITKVNEAFGVHGLRNTGMPLLRGLPSLNLVHTRHNEGIKNGFFLSLGDYVSYLLCGNMAVHASNCAGSGLMDLEQGTWNHQALERMGCSDFYFPPVTEDFQPMGTCQKLNNAKVFPAVGDQQAALLGAMINDDDLSLNVGTGSQVSMISRDLVFGNFQTRPFFSGEYLKTITHIPAGRAVNVLVAFSLEMIKRVTHQEVGPVDFWKSYYDVDYTEGNLNVDPSFFSGSTTGDAGGIANIQEGNFTMQNLLAATYRRMASNYYELSKRIGSERAIRVIISGGMLTKNAVLHKAINNQFQPLPVMQHFSEDTLVGLYIIALTHELGHMNFRETYQYIEQNGLSIEDNNCVF